ncbi:hypothetical protein L3Q82_009328 [Scortum barcoo]|uniref:Uncharacterized protein n=1 Tax=Scortum barcoo TaxID=214431 RepID=A0ACB8WGB6_9TELE|nr:hypothetical protein L3Q82_009328 [Scortum barcoo]
MSWTLTWVKRGAELSTDHHLVVVVSWIRWQRRKLDRPGRPKRIVRVCQEIKDLLNPTDLPSDEEVEAGNSEEDSSITQAEVTEVVRKPIGRVLEGLWEFAQPFHMCFVDLEKTFNLVPCGILWGVLCATRTFSMYWSSWQPKCEAAGMRISTSKSEGHWFSTGKGWRALSGWVERSCLKWRSSSISGVLFTSEGKKMEREIDRRIGWCSVLGYAVGIRTGPSW